VNGLWMALSDIAAGLSRILSLSSQEGGARSFLVRLAAHVTNG